MKRIRFVFLVWALIAPVLLFIGLITIISPTTVAYAAPINVTNLNDNGAGSLRQAITDTNPGDVITFNITGTILLISDLSIDKALTIDGGNGITVSGNNSVRVFNIGVNGIVTLANLAIVNGYSAIGGGIYNRGSLTLTNSIVSNNCRCIVSGTTGGGGIHSAVTGSLAIINSTISDNIDNASSTYGGGGIITYGSMTISNSLISGNYTTGFGGGISNRGITTIKNSTMIENRAGAGGGGISIASGPTTIILNSTIISNVAENGFFGGGGIIIASGSVSMGHTVLANNSPNDCQNDTLNSLDYNLIRTNSGCTINGATSNNIMGQDPNLGPLQDNGGPTLTNKPNIGSPVINNGAATCGVTMDQRGAARPYDVACDIGAFETHETIIVGSCAGPELSGTYPFAFTSGNTVTVTVITPNGLNCIEIEEMGPTANHSIPTGVPDLGIYPGNWWHITGNITSGFMVDITLPYVGANGDSRVCKLTKGFGWGCGPQNGAGTSNTTNSVMRTGIGSFSDWAVGYIIVPTAVTLSSISITSSIKQVGIFTLFVLLLGLTFVMWRYRSHPTV